MSVTEEYTEYVVCPKCNSLYSYDDCLEVRANGQEWSIAKCCEFVESPNYRFQYYQTACGELLLKKSQLLGGNIKFIHIHTIQ